jgi:hypothetical protein
LLEYVGKGKSIVDVGLAQSRLPLNTRCHYYELEITDAGEKCYIALGLARRVCILIIVLFLCLFLAVKSKREVRKRNGVLERQTSSGFEPIPEYWHSCVL